MGTFKQWLVKKAIERQIKKQNKEKEKLGNRLNAELEATLKDYKQAMSDVRLLRQVAETKLKAKTIRAETQKTLNAIRDMDMGEDGEDYEDDEEWEDSGSGGLEEQLLGAIIKPAISKLTGGGMNISPNAENLASGLGNASNAEELRKKGQEILAKLSPEEIEFYGDWLKKKGYI